MRARSRARGRSLGAARPCGAALPFLHLGAALTARSLFPFSFARIPRAGQDRFGTLYRIYYRDAFGALLVFDLTRPETFHSVLRVRHRAAQRARSFCAPYLTAPFPTPPATPQWKREIDSKVQLPNGKPLPVVLLANKCDLPEPAVNKDQLDAFCKEHGFVCWFETSAKDNKNIEEAVKGLVANILSHPDALQAQTEQKKVEEAAKPANVNLDGSDKKAASGGGGGCC